MAHIIWTIWLISYGQNYMIRTKGYSLGHFIARWLISDLFGTEFDVGQTVNPIKNG